MKAQGGGKVINIGSMYSVFGGPFQPAYAASKAAVGALTSLALTHQTLTPWAEPDCSGRLAATWPRGRRRVP